MRTLSHPIAYLIVVASAIAAVMLVRLAWDWSRWVLTAVGGAGVAGLVLAAAATVNLGVPRTCARETGVDGSKIIETNRPAISVFLGGDECYADAVGQFEILGLIVVGVSAVAVRQSTGSDPTASPGVPTA